MDESENIGELKSQLENPEEVEETEEKTEENEETEEEGGEEETNEEIDEEINEEETEDETEEEGGKKFTMPEKFKNKKPEEIAKSYIKLEGMIDKKVEKRADELVKMKEDEEEEGGEKPKKKEIKEEDEGPPMKGGKIDYGSMTPEQFAQWVDKRIEDKAESKSREIITGSQRIRTAVRSEIGEVKKEHPNLKKNPEYTEAVLSFIEAASSRGKTVSLKEACTKVDALIGKKKEIGDKEEKKLKRVKSEVETGGGVPPGGKETEEERIKNGMVSGTKTGELGGLGV